MKYTIVFLRPKEFARFRIQNGFFDEETISYIPSDMIYSLYLSKMYEEGKIDNRGDGIDIQSLPNISSAYPYLIKSNEIYFYLPTPYKITTKKKINKKLRSVGTFFRADKISEILKKDCVDEIEFSKNLLDISSYKRLVTRNKINRISSTTGKFKRSEIDRNSFIVEKEGGNLFYEEWVFCYSKKENQNIIEEFGFYFLMDKYDEEFLNAIKEYIEVRGIGADKSTSSSTFNVETYSNQTKISDFDNIKNFDEATKKLINEVENFRKEGILLHTMPFENIKNYLEYPKIVYYVIDGLYVYPIVVDGSKLKNDEDVKKINEKGVKMEIERRNKKFLQFKIFKGL